MYIIEVAPGSHVATGLGIALKWPGILQLSHFYATQREHLRKILKMLFSVFSVPRAFKDILFVFGLIQLELYAES